MLHSQYVNLYSYVASILVNKYYQCIQCTAIIMENEELANVSENCSVST